MPDSITAPVPTAVEKKPRTLAEQDQRLADALAASFTLLTIAAEDPEILALLTPRGYDAATVNDAIATLHAPAQAAYDARQVAIGAESSANTALAAVEAQERKDWADYREIARAAFPCRRSSSPSA